MKANVLKIGVDLDGVVAMFDRSFAKIVNELAPGTIPADYFETGPKDWDWTDVLSSELSNRAWEVLKNTTNFWQKLEPFEENVLALRRFLEAHSMSVEVYYVTSRVPCAGSQLLTQCSRWLDALGLLKSYTSVIPVDSGKVKGEVYRALGVGRSIDDRDINVTTAQAAFASLVRPIGANHPKPAAHYAYILDRPYNRTLNWPRRVTSLNQFLQDAWANFEMDEIAAIAAKTTGGGQ